MEHQQDWEDRRQFGKASVCGSAAVKQSYGPREVVSAGRVRQCGKLRCLVFKKMDTTALAFSNHRSDQLITVNVKARRHQPKDYVPLKAQIMVSIF